MRNGSKHYVSKKTRSRSCLVSLLQFYTANRYDACRRLTAAENATTKLEFSYDYMGRRATKKVYTKNGTSWNLQTTKNFVYDGYKQIAEYAGTTATMLTVWQPESSGDFDVPLWSKTGTEVQTYTVDGNQNVRQLKNAAGTPFPWQFSSEYRDEETDLVYYNYRYYDPKLGRWINRGPIGENGSMNLYWQNTNDPINAWDFRGMWKSTNTDIWEAAPGDSLWKLAKEITGQGDDWQCIWPICYNGNTDQYPNSIQVGDTFDASNLTAKAGTNLYVSIASTDTAFGKAYTILRPQAVFVSDNDTFHSEIKRVAGEGKTPIKYFELVGHGESSYLIPGVKDQQGPQRWWFTRNASGFSISCMGEPLGKEFANNFLRKGANIKTSPGNANIWARYRGDVTFWAFGREASPADKEYKRWAQFKSHPQWVTHHGRL